MSLPTPGVAIIGCGLIGQKRAAHLPAGCLRVACDSDIVRAERLAAAHPGCRAVASVAEVVRIPDLGAAIVATINSELAPSAAAAARAGLHVLVEKPGGISVADLESIAAAAKEGNSLVRVGYNHRFHPAAIKATALFRSGEIGPILMVRGRYGHGGRVGYEKEWRAEPRLSGGGELIDQGVHLIDLAGVFLGDFAKVEGHVSTRFWEMPVEDNAFVSLRNAGGATAWLHASCAEWKNMFSLEIYGRDAKLHWEGLGGSYGTERLAYYKMLPEMGPPETTIWEFPRNDTSWRAEMDEFFEDISLGRTPVPGLAEAEKTLAVVEQIYRLPR
jgi:predicted dehydrogenase